MARIDLSGQRFGTWTVLRFDGVRGERRRGWWACRCDCGHEKPIRGDSLLGGRSNGCMSCKNRTHGEGYSVARGRSTGTYNSWVSMTGRCRNPNNIGWHLYGGRGIVVCERWASFENFLADMGERPEGKTLDRYPDSNGNYEPANCRWATAKEQGRHGRLVKLSVEKAAKIRALAPDVGRAALARQFGVSRVTIDKIIKGRIWA